MRRAIRRSEERRGRASQESSDAVTPRSRGAVTSASRGGDSRGRGFDQVERAGLRGALRVREAAPRLRRATAPPIWCAPSTPQGWDRCARKRFDATLPRPPKRAAARRHEVNRGPESPVPPGETTRSTAPRRCALMGGRTTAGCRLGPLGRVERYQLPTRRSSARPRPKPWALYARRHTHRGG